MFHSLFLDYYFIFVAGRSGHKSFFTLPTSPTASSSYSIGLDESNLNRIIDTLMPLSIALIYRSNNNNKNQLNSIRSLNFVQHFHAHPWGSPFNRLPFWSPHWNYNTHISLFLHQTTPQTPQYTNKNDEKWRKSKVKEEEKKKRWAKGIQKWLGLIIIGLVTNKKWASIHPISTQITICECNRFELRSI